ncbi:MAG: hypothetical protein ACRC42_02085 [Mycoplasma sp.]
MAFVKWTFATTFATSNTLSGTCGIGCSVDNKTVSTSTDLCMKLTFTEVGTTYKILTLTGTIGDTYKITAPETIAVVEYDYKVTNSAYFSNAGCTNSIDSEGILLANPAYVKLEISPDIVSGSLGGECEPACNVQAQTITNSGDVCLELRFTASGTYKIKSLTLTDKTFDISAIASNTIVVNDYKATNAQYFTNNDCSTSIDGDITLNNNSAEAYVLLTISPGFEASGKRLIGECQTGCTFTPKAVAQGATTACAKLAFTKKGTYFISKLNLDGETDTFDISAISTKTIVVKEDDGDGDDKYKATNAQYFTNNDCSTSIDGDIKIKDKSAEAYILLTISPGFEAAKQLLGECQTGCTFTPKDVAQGATTACAKLAFTKKGTYFITKLNLDGETDTFDISAISTKKIEIKSGLMSGHFGLFAKILLLSTILLLI